MIDGGFGSAATVTLFSCDVAARAGKPSAAVTVRSIFVPLVAAAGTATLNVRDVERPFTTGFCDVTLKPLVAASVSEVTATSSVAAAATAMLWPAKISAGGVTSNCVMFAATFSTTLNADTALSAVRPARSTTIALSVALPAVAVGETRIVGLVAGIGDA